MIRRTNTFLKTKYLPKYKGRIYGKPLAWEEMLVIRATIKGLQWVKV
jgi:hypothetical protein